MDANAGELEIPLVKARGDKTRFDAIQYVERLAARLAAKAGIVGVEINDISQDALLGLLRGLRKQRKEGPIENEEYFVRALARQRIQDALDKRFTQKAKLVRAWSCIPDASVDATDEDHFDTREANVPDPHQDPEYLELIRRVREVVAELPRQLKSLCELLVAEKKNGRRLSETEIARRLHTSRPQLKRLMLYLQQKFISAGFGNFSKKVVPKSTPVPAVYMGEAFVPAPELIERQSQLRSHRRVMASNCSRPSIRTLASAAPANY